MNTPKGVVNVDSHKWGQISHTLSHKMWCNKITIYSQKGVQTMARVPMVTRTMKTTKVNVLCMDLVKAEPCNKDLTLPRTFKDDKKLFKAVEAVINSDDIKAVQIVKKKEIDTLYGMTEQEFIETAKVLDKETRKIKAQ